MHRLSTAARRLRNGIPNVVARVWVPVAWLVALALAVVDVLAGTDYLAAKVGVELAPWVLPLLPAGVLFATALREWYLRHKTEDKLGKAQEALAQAVRERDDAEARSREAVHAGEDAAKERDEAKESLDAVTNVHDISRRFRDLYERGTPMLKQDLLNEEWVAEAVVAIDRYCPRRSGVFAEASDPNAPRKDIHFGDKSDARRTPKQIAQAMLNVVKAIADDPPRP